MGVNVRTGEGWSHGRCIVPRRLQWRPEHNRAFGLRARIRAETIDSSARVPGAYAPITARISSLGPTATSMKPPSGRIPGQSISIESISSYSVSRWDASTASKA